MYKIPKMAKSQMKSIEIVEGETIEHKIERILRNKEPIKDGAPEIFTERKQGVVAGYNIRTDRWEHAVDAMDLVTKSQLAKRDERHKPDMKIVKDETDNNESGQSKEGGQTKEGGA